MRRLHRKTALGSRSLGVPEWDGALWRIGREWLTTHRDAVQSAHSEGAPWQSDVYLATELYSIGGHTALIGDFVRALDAPSSHVILTNLGADPASVVSEPVRLRLGLPAEHIAVLPGPSALDRMQQLFTLLLRLKPRRLFLFQHPHDPLASVAAQPEIASQCVLVHHADSMPSFGMHLPDVRIVDLNPSAAALTRLLGCASALLPLTAPDPGPRLRGFLNGGRLVTATSGRPHKFSSRYVLGYAETVGVVLKITGGRHVHIGPLYEETSAEIASALHREQIPPDRFVHIVSTTSIAATLWEHECDLYLASFPVDGARTRVEVLASATPYLRHAARSDSGSAAPQSADGSLIWRTWEDLGDTLRRMANAAALEANGVSMRRLYEGEHHPRIFAGRLATILARHVGADEADPRDRADRAVESMVRSVTASVIDEDRDPDHVLERLEIEGRRIDVLEQERERLAREVARLHEEQEHWRGGRGARARFRQWLMR